MTRSTKTLDSTISSLIVEQGDQKFVERLDPSVLPKGVTKDTTQNKVESIKLEIELLQSKLWAQSTESLLVVLQGLDTAGKDSTIRRVFEGVNPQGVEVHSFKVPSAEESAHDFLWRAHKVTPKTGMITIFNRSYYEDLLVPLATNSLPDSTIKRRVDSVLDFESHLATNGVHILKFYLSISDKEQDKRLLERLDMEDKNWKFSASDLTTRRNRKAYKSAYHKTISETSTNLAPWYVVPSDHRWYRDFVVLAVVLKKMREMNPHFPKAQRETITLMREELKTIEKRRASKPAIFE